MREKSSATNARIADLAQPSLLGELWEHFPGSMFLIRVEEPDGFVLEAANPAEIATFGEACEGCYLHEFLPKVTADAVSERYRECLRQNAPIRYEEHESIYGPYGEPRQQGCLTLLIPLRDEARRVTHLFGVSQDITELRRATQALERKNLELEAVVEERTARLREANEELRQLNAQLEVLATVDPLTGTLNRRHVETLVERELSRAARGEITLALIMLDLDRFKEVNDTQGHAAGDTLLQQVATTIKGELRDSDILARLGGDEFVIVLPGTSAEKASAVAERLRHMVAANTGVTASLGVTEYKEGDACLGDLASRADAQLMTAKKGGRNRHQ